MRRPSVNDMFGPTPRSYQHSVKAYRWILHHGLLREKKLRRAFKSRALPARDDFGGLSEGRTRFDLYDNKRMSALRDQVDLANRGAASLRENTIALQAQRKTAERFGK